MYVEDRYIFPASVEHEIKWSGRYGARGEKRKKKRKPTRREIERQNAWKRETQSRRVMKLNFKKGDLWLTIMYPKGTKKRIEEVKKDIGRFLRRIRAAYKTRGDDLMFMYRIEIGSRGGVHIHMIVNHVRGEPPIDMVIQSAWKEGRVHFERFGGEEDDYRKLASYLVKAQNEEQMEKRTPEERRILRAYSSSRNLKRPKPERKKYKRRTVRRILEEGPKPRRGYAIDKTSIDFGVNPYTGLSYMRYTEIRIGGSG